MGSDYLSMLVFFQEDDVFQKNATENPIMPMLILMLAVVATFQVTFNYSQPTSTCSIVLN